MFYSTYLMSQIITAVTNFVCFPCPYFCNQMSTKHGCTLCDPWSGCTTVLCCVPEGNLSQVWVGDLTSAFYTSHFSFQIMSTRAKHWRLLVLTNIRLIREVCEHPSPCMWPKNVTKLSFTVKPAGRSHRCPADTNKSNNMGK